MHLIALAEHSQMSAHVPGFQEFSGFLHYFVLTKLATSSIRVKYILVLINTYILVISDLCSAIWNTKIQ